MLLPHGADGCGCCRFTLPEGVANPVLEECEEFGGLVRVSRTDVRSVDEGKRKGKERAVDSGGKGNGRERAVDPRGKGKRKERAVD